MQFEADLLKKSKALIRDKLPGASLDCSMQLTAQLVAFKLSLQWPNFASLPLTASNCFTGSFCRHSYL